MTLPGIIEARLSDLRTRFTECREEFELIRDAEDDADHNELRDEVYIPIFKDACAMIREAGLIDAPYLAELTKSIGGILNNEIQYALGEGNSEGSDKIGLFSLMPSWAHDDLGEIKDKNGRQLPFPPSALEKFLEIFAPIMAEGVTGDSIKNQYRKDPWHASMKRHPKSTRMARFRPDLPPLTLTSENSITESILNARCEMFSSQCATPIRFHISPLCLALTGMAGYKNRSPYVEYIILAEPLAPLVDFPNKHSVKPTLADIVYHAAIDDSRRLIFAGDDSRIKSYEWGSTEEIYKKPLAVHTLNSTSANGPMTMLPNGSLARAGKGGVSVWDLQGLPTHRGPGDTIIGDTIQEFDTWRDDEDEIERSSGSSPASRIKFFDHPNFTPDIWHPLVSAPSTMLCAEKARRTGDYSCIGIDLETGKSTSYYLGHGDEVTTFSTTPSDPQLFLTACGDGFVRLFDLRRPLPAVTIDACGLTESCEAAAIAMPDGIPTVFTGTHQREQIRLWDVRARACVYELSTGNNAVESLAWDNHNNCLYAATQSNHHDYRYAKIPKSQRSNQGDDDEDDDEEDEDEDDEDAGMDGQRCWPKGAWHTEDYFGYLFDAGGNCIIRYTFKEDPNPSVLPMYGSASVGGNWGW